MTRILALDTSTRLGSVALVDAPGTAAGGQAVVVSELGDRIDASHAEHLLDWIERLLAEAGWSKSSLDAYAASRGPGSFTGIRVGLGTVRGLALATGRPCFGVTALEALAEAHGPAEWERVPLIEAGRGELFGARYDAAGSPPVEREAPWVGRSDDVVTRQASVGGVLIPGPGTRVVLQPGACLARVAPAPRFLAGAVGRLVATSGLLCDGPPPPLVPLYVRPPDVRVGRGRA